MVVPQLENGYLSIAHQIVEQLCWYQLSPVESLIVWVIFRKTYGFHKKEDHIALSQFSELTKVSKTNIHRAIKKLEKKRVIIVHPNVRKGNLFHLNKHLWEWVSPKQSIPHREYTGIPQGEYTVSPRESNTKDNIKIKDNGDKSPVVKKNKRASDISIKAVKLLCSIKNIPSLDGFRNHQYADEVIAKIREDMAHSNIPIPETDDGMLEALGNLIENVKRKGGYNWENLTNYLYLRKNFSKLVNLK